MVLAYRRTEGFWGVPLVSQRRKQYATRTPFLRFSRLSLFLYFLDAATTATFGSVKRLETSEKRSETKPKRSQQWTGCYLFYGGGFPPTGLLLLVTSASVDGVESSLALITPTVLRI